MDRRAWNVQMAIDHSDSLKFPVPISGQDRPAPLSEFWEPEWLRDFSNQREVGDEERRDRNFFESATGNPDSLPAPFIDRRVRIGEQQVFVGAHDARLVCPRQGLAFARPEGPPEAVVIESEEGN
jgi:hypothetical protein